jgi:ABC-2 type transport system permease protein
MRAAAGAFRMQLILGFRTPNYWMTQLITIPQTLIFLSAVHAFGRSDLALNAVLAPMLISMWNTAVWAGGSVIRDDKWEGRLELHAASPAGYGFVVGVRMLAVVLLSLVAMPSALLTAALSYGLHITVEHPVVLVLVLLLTAFAVAGTGVVFSSMTILNRAAVMFQNTITYPLLLLAGVFVPLALLPGWVQPLGRLVVLSWSSDLIRESLTSPTVADVPWRLLAIVVLGVVGLLAGQKLVTIILYRLRISGEISAQ